MSQLGFSVSGVKVKLSAFGIQLGVRGSGIRESELLNIYTTVDAINPALPIIKEYTIIPIV